MTIDMREGISFDKVGKLLFASIKKNSSVLRDKMSKLGPTPNTEDLLALQMMMQQWTVGIETGSAIIKNMADLMKNILQRM